MALLCAFLTFVLLSVAAKGRHLMFEQPSSGLAERFPALANDNAIILTQVSCGYLEFADNWAVHMDALEIENWLMVAEDTTALQYLSERQAPRFAPAGSTITAVLLLIPAHQGLVNFPTDLARWRPSEATHACCVGTQGMSCPHQSSPARR